MSSRQITVNRRALRDYHVLERIEAGIELRGTEVKSIRLGHVSMTGAYARIEKGERKPEILVGPLGGARDFTDVRDMVRGYVAALEKGKPGEVYNICHGTDYSVQEVLDLLLEMTSLEVRIDPDPDRMRPSDVPVLLGSAEKFRRDTGWEPRISFEQTLRDLLDYWRDRLGKPDVEMP